MGKLSFKELIEKLKFFSVENNMEKTIEEIRDECRQFIINSGFECAEENFEPDVYVSELIDDVHPDWNTENFEWSIINYQPLEFLCIDQWTDDLCFAEMNIHFYGDFANGIGIFNVTD